MDGDFSSFLKVQSTPRRLTGNYQAKDWTGLSHRYPHLNDINFSKPCEPRYCDLLIGTDHSELHASFEECSGSPEHPVSARLGPLGWTCIGCLSPSLNATSNTEHCFTCYVNTSQQSVSDLSLVNSASCNQCCSVDILDKTLRDSWSLDEPRPGDHQVMTSAQRERYL